MQHCYHSIYKQVRVLVFLVLVTAYVRSNFYSQLRKRAAEESKKMKAWNGEVNCYCPKEQSLMANDIRGLMVIKFSHCLFYSWEKPWKEPKPRKLTRTGINPGSARWEETMLPGPQRWSTCTGRPGVQNHLVQSMKT